MSEAGGDSSHDVPDIGFADSAAARRLVEEECIRLSRELRAFLLGVLRDVSLADDALQRTAVRAIQSCEAVRKDTVRGWLFRVALNEARQLQRVRRQDNRVRQKFGEQVAETQSAYLANKSDWWNESGVLREDISRLVRASLEKLPEEHRQVIQKRVYEGLTFAEIAADLGQPLGTVLTWMRRGLSRLREDSGLRDLWVE